MTNLYEIKPQPGNDRQLCLASGMDDFLVKPVTYRNLINVLKRQLDNPRK